MRLLVDNIADTALISADPAMEATLPETNLQNELRGKVARWTAVDGQTITLSWSGAKPISCVCLYRSSLSATATWRVRVYEDATLVTLVYDSGTVNACAPVPFGSLEWGVDPLGLSLYTYWSYAVSVAWFGPVLGGAVVINVADPENPDGYVDAARLFVGRYFEPSGGVWPGMGLGYKENTKQVRTEGGTLRKEPGEGWRTLRLDLKMMDENDRRRIIGLLRDAGLRRDVFVSIFPGRANELERDHQMQASLVDLSPFAHEANDWTAIPLTFEEI